ncbi:hypothetical protein SADUNF_Sadunf17G0136600 [Salix dunnii]|uniref:Uncharacterized protein n=1 Tax=Salix dunnii TaxID=1413687 RepID=A0A835MFK5_9ROSI|nr:hypothetical protein SADUNF_Sadunf17G0136600 [Salix dunnii]
MMMFFVQDWEKFDARVYVGHATLAGENEAAGIKNSLVQQIGQLIDCQKNNSMDESGSLFLRQMGINMNSYLYSAEQMLLSSASLTQLEISVAAFASFQPG